MDKDVKKAIEMAGGKFRLQSIGEDNTYKVVTLIDDEIYDGFSCPMLFINKKTGAEHFCTGPIGIEEVPGFENLKFRDLTFDIFEERMI